VRAGADDVLTRVGARGPLADAGSVTLARGSRLDDALAPPLPGAGPQQYNAVVRPGPLADPAGGYVGRQAGNFRNGSYTGRVLDEPMVVHRYYGGLAGPDGAYWTPGLPHGPGQAQLGNAVDPGWGNTLTQVEIRVIPAGTTVYIGPAAPKPVTAVPEGMPTTSASAGEAIDAGGELLGGDLQVFLPEMPPSWEFPSRG
jgi:3D (Asp-Asp-Asp) domain-containing protein